MSALEFDLMHSSTRLATLAMSFLRAHSKMAHVTTTGLRNATRIFGKSRGGILLIVGDDVRSI
jgi:hypothetical protein